MRYFQLIVGAGGIIEAGGRLLLIRRKRAPFLGSWCLPAGHVDHDEAPHIAVVREVLEETGLEVTVHNLVDAYFFDDHPKGCGVFLVYKCEVTGGSIRETHESAAHGFFASGTLPVELAGGVLDCHPTAENLTQLLCFDLYRKFEATELRFKHGA